MASLLDRDRLIILLLARFQQLTAVQVFDLLFYPGRSITPVYRALQRLTAHDFVRRVEVGRVVGGRKGGGGQYVYALGRRGAGLIQADYKPARSVDYHQLLLADCYRLFVRLQRADFLTIDGWSVEPEVIKIPNEEDLMLWSDMRIDVTRRDRVQYALWLEVDMATEGRKQVTDKLVRQRKAMYGGQWTITPRPVWVACDEERAKELRWFIDQGRDAEVKRLYSVVTLETLPNIFYA